MRCVRPAYAALLIRRECRHTEADIAAVHGASLVGLVLSPSAPTESSSAFPTIAFARTRFDLRIAHAGTGVDGAKVTKRAEKPSGSREILAITPLPKVGPIGTVSGRIIRPPGRKRSSHSGWGWVTPALIRIASHSPGSSAAPSPSELRHWSNLRGYGWRDPLSPSPLRWRSHGLPSPLLPP